MPILLIYMQLADYYPKKTMMGLKCITSKGVFKQKPNAWEDLLGIIHSFIFSNCVPEVKGNAELQQALLLYYISAIGYRKREKD